MLKSDEFSASKYSFLRFQTLFSDFTLISRLVTILISWKGTLERMNEELRQTNAKKQALDTLFDAGKISPVTYENFNRDLEEALAEIQTRRENLVRKMHQQTLELEQKIAALEAFLVNCEIQHAGGEIEDALYQSEVNVWATGLETIREELNTLNESINILQTEIMNPLMLSPPSAPEPATTQETVQIETLEVKTEQITVVENVENISQPTPTTEEQKIEEKIEAPKEEMPKEEIKAEEQPVESPAETTDSFREEEKPAQETTQETN